MERPKAHVLIVEDEPIIAQNIKRVLQASEYAVSGVAYTSTRALDMLATRNPDAVLLDITIKGDMDGIQLAEIINQKHHIPFLYLTAHSDDATLERAKHTLPYGYIVKPFKDKDVIAALEMALFKHNKQNASPYPDIDEVNNRILSSLTEKEYTLMCDVCDGLTNKQLADKYHNTINTVKHHLKSIYAKLDVGNRATAIKVFRGQ